MYARHIGLFCLFFAHNGRELFLRKPTSACSDAPAACGYSTPGVFFGGVGPTVLSRNNMKSCFRRCIKKQMWVCHKPRRGPTTGIVCLASAGLLEVDRSAESHYCSPPYHSIRVAHHAAHSRSLLKVRVRLSQRARKVGWRRTRLRSGGLGEPPFHRSAGPTDQRRPRSSHLSQIACQISLVPKGAAHRTPIACHFHRFASSGDAV